MLRGEVSVLHVEVARQPVIHLLAQLPRVTYTDYLHTPSRHIWTERHAMNQSRFHALSTPRCVRCRVTLSRRPAAAAWPAIDRSCDSSCNHTSKYTCASRSRYYTRRLPRLRGCSADSHRIGQQGLQPKDRDRGRDSVPGPRGCLALQRRRFRRSVRSPRRSPLGRSSALRSAHRMRHRRPGVGCKTGWRLDADPFSETRRTVTYF